MNTSPKSDRYLHLFSVESSTSNKKYKISIDKTKTQENDNTIVLSCNCPSFVHQKTRTGDIKECCKHLIAVWGSIERHSHIVNPFSNPQMFCNMVGWECSGDWFNDSPEQHIGKVLSTGHGTWIANNLTSVIFPLVQTRMCVSCYTPQQIPLDLSIFSCETCGRRQRV